MRATSALGKRSPPTSLEPPGRKRPHTVPLRTEPPPTPVSDTRLNAAKQAALALVVEAARRDGVRAAAPTPEGRQRLAILYAAGAVNLMVRFGIQQSVPIHVRAAMEGSLFPEVRDMVPRSGESLLPSVTMAQARRLTQLVTEAASSAEDADADGSPPATCRSGPGIPPSHPSEGGSGGGGAPAA